MTQDDPQDDPQDDGDESVVDTADLVDTGDEEAMISLLRSGDGAAVRRPSNTGGKPPLVQAVVRSVAERNQVLVGLSHVDDPELRTSITLPPDDALRLAERIFDATLELPHPPKQGMLRRFLNRVLQKVEATTTGAKSKKATGAKSKKATGAKSKKATAAKSKKATATAKSKKH